MSKWNNLNDWLINEEDVLASALDPLAGGPPSGAQPPGLPGAGAISPPPGADATVNPNPLEAPVPQDGSGQQVAAGEIQVSPPDSPDMPEEQKSQTFDDWRSKFFKESIKSDVNQLIEMISKIRNNDLDTYPRKFVEDNLQILFLRQNANIDKASQEIRKSIKDQLDQNNPSTSLVQYMVNSLQNTPDLSNVFIKLIGLYGSKGDAHRKYVAALLGAVQVGSGGQNEDLIFNQREYSIKISTRINSKFGMVDLGRWSMSIDDPEKFLADPEIERLEDGSPEEKDVLRKRVMLESMADIFRMRAFFINVIGNDGTVYFVGLDLSNGLKEGYSNGKLIVKTMVNDNSEALYNDQGELTELVDIKVMYQKETGKLDENGNPQYKEIEFIAKKEGMLFLTANLETLKEAASAFQGLVVKEIPYNGNPSDIPSLMRCVPSMPETLLRNCL